MLRNSRLLGQWLLAILAAMHWMVFLVSSLDGVCSVSSLVVDGAIEFNSIVPGACLSPTMTTNGGRLLEID